MLKSTELRIGNLFQDQDGNLLNINCIDDEGSRIGTHVLDRSKHPLKKGWQMQPIPLSESKILNLGFKDLGDSFDCHLFSKGIFAISLKDGVFVFILKRKASSAFVPLKEIKYVHELQNIYFELMNEDLIFININPQNNLA